MAIYTKQKNAAGQWRYQRVNTGRRGVKDRRAVNRRLATICLSVGFTRGFLSEVTSVALFRTDLFLSSFGSSRYLIPTRGECGGKRQR